MKTLVVDIVFSLLAIVAFNAVAFLPPFNHTEAFWAGYFCCWLVTVASFAVVAVAAVGSERGERILYGFPFFYAAMLYLVIGVAFDVAAMAFVAIPLWSVVLVNVILTALLIVMFVVSGVSRDYIEAQDREKAAQMSFVVALRTQTQTLVAASAASGVAADARALNDAARFSDPMSAPALANEENAIMSSVLQAIDQVNRGNEGAARASIQQAQVQLEQRNRLVKAYK